MANRYKATVGKSPGDPAKVAQQIVDIARLENLTEEQKKNLPLRIPFGPDALRVMQAKCTDTLVSLKDWEEFAASTNFEDGSAISGNYK